LKVRMVIQMLGVALLTFSMTGCIGNAAKESDPIQNGQASAQNMVRKAEKTIRQPTASGVLDKQARVAPTSTITEEWLPQDRLARQESKNPAKKDPTGYSEQDETAKDRKPINTPESLDLEVLAVDMTAEEEELARIQPGGWQPDPEIEPLYVRVFTDVIAGHNDSNPIWSPTGKLVAFERSIADRREIIISHADGLVLQKIYCRLPEEDSAMDFVFENILDDASYNAGISWSPDESQLVFMSNGGSGNYDLYLLPVLGQERTIRLTDNEERDSQPQWNPAADRLVFVSGRTGSAEIYLMDLTARKVTKLTNGRKTYLYPQWSPDGDKIVMIYGSNENHDIYLITDINRPAETLKALTTWRYDDLRPVWSPDGRKIAFYSNYNRENNPKVWSIIVIAADGSDPADGERLAEKVVAKNVIPDIEQGPAWMPDSKRIVYVKNDRQSFNPIYMVDIEVKKNVAIKTQTKMNHDIACSADGRLAFRAQVEQWDHIYIVKLQE